MRIVPASLLLALLCSGAGWAQNDDSLQRSRNERMGKIVLDNDLTGMAIAVVGPA